MSAERSNAPQHVVPFAPCLASHLGALLSLPVFSRPVVSGSYHGAENLPSAKRSSLDHLPSSQLFVPR